MSTFAILYALFELAVGVGIVIYLHFISRRKAS